METNYRQIEFLAGDTIETAINVDNIKSMIALIEYKGIGLTTMQKCFRF